VVRWASTRADLPRVRVWIGPYKNLHGVVEPTIQFNDSFESDGQGKDALIGELASKGSRDILAECLANREEEGFYDADFFDDEEDIGALRTCGEPHPTIPSGTTGTARCPSTTPTTSIRPSGAPNGPAAGPDSGSGPLRGRQVGEVEAPVGAQLDLAVGRHVGVEQRGEAAPVGVGEDVFPLG
jgi:hypothetical protein